MGEAACRMAETLVVQMSARAEPADGTDGPAGHGSPADPLRTKPLFPATKPAPKSPALSPAHSENLSLRFSTRANSGVCNRRCSPGRRALCRVARPYPRRLRSTPKCRRALTRQYADASQIDRPGVKVGVSQGGGSDQILSRALKSAQVVRVPGWSTQRGRGAAHGHS